MRDPSAYRFRPVLLVDSPEWRTSIEQSNPGRQLAAADTMEKLQSILLNSIGVFAVIQLSSADGVRMDRIQFVANQLANWNQACFIAIGDDKLVTLKPIICQLGFAEVWLDPFRMDRLWQIAERHWSHVKWPVRSLEQQFESGLPWAE